MFPLSSSNGQMVSRPLIQVMQPLLFCLLLLLNNGDAVQYKVGDLDSWSLPPQSNPDIYELWSESHHFHVGDSLLFLYPPNEDSVIQVTERAFNRCSLAEPLMKFDDGNSIFNLTVPGRFYFTSGVPGHCEKLQKLAVVVPSAATGSFFPPVDVEGPAPSSGAATDSAPPAGAPSYPLVFGPSASEKSSGKRAAAAAGSALAFALVGVLVF